MRRGIWPRDGRASPGSISGRLSLWPRVTVTVQFSHQDGGLGECTWAGGGVARGGAHALRVCATETVLEKDLEGGAHGVALSKGERPYNEVGGDRRLRDRDYAAHPLAMGRIHMVILVCFPQLEGEGLQEGLRGFIRDVVCLGFDSQFCEVVVLAMGAGPVTREETGVSACGLSIKLDGKMVDRDCDVRVKEALHTKRPCEQGSLGEVLVFCQGQEGAEKVPIGNKDDSVTARVRTEGKDTRNGSVGGSKRVVMAGPKTAFDAHAIGKGEEGGYKVIGVWERVDVDGVVVGGGLVCKVNDGRGAGWRRQSVEGVEYARVRPCKTSRNAKDGE